MIATSIGLGIWTSGLLWMSMRAEKRRVMISEDGIQAKEGAFDETAGVERGEEKV